MGYELWPGMGGKGYPILGPPARSPAPGHALLYAFRYAVFCCSSMSDFTCGSATGHQSVLS